MNPAPNLILIGPMGAGKTSIGRRLAERFGLRFVDLDRDIELDAGRSIPDLFANEGEAGFRLRERSRLAARLRESGLLIATGGGAVLDADNRRDMRSHGFVVHLHVSTDEQLTRLARDRSRPLLNTPDRAEVLQRLAAERAPLYAETADLRFEPGGLTLADACGKLAVLLRDRWQLAPHSPSTQPPDPSPTQTTSA
jgi:shikimate kinase